MTILANTLRLSIGTWDDPGVYPNNLASSPLRSRRYVDAVEGAVTVRLDAKDDGIDFDALCNLDSLEGACVSEWAEKVQADGTVKLFAQDWSDGNWRDG